jgi:hypothetical protein
MGMLEAKVDYTVGEYARMFVISKKAFRRILSEAHVRESSRVKGVPCYRMKDVMKHIMLQEMVPEYASFSLYTCGGRGETAEGIVDSFLRDYRLNVGKEYEGSVERLMERVSGILRSRKHRGKVLKIVRADGKIAYVFAEHASPEQKKAAEERRRTVKAAFYYNPANGMFYSTFDGKKLGGDEVELLKRIYFYVDALLRARIQ